LFAAFPLAGAAAAEGTGRSNFRRQLMPEGKKIPRQFINRSLKPLLPRRVYLIHAASDLITINRPFMFVQ
jgi:hypothetical protein